MLNVAIYGPGRWARRLVTSVKGSTQVRFVAGVSRQPDRHADFADMFNIPVRTQKEVLADPGVDAVLIATPHSEHAAQAIAAARAGKHVFCEKPLALTRSDAEAIVAACKAAGVTLGVGYNRRFSPAFLEIQRRVREGELGQVLYLEGQFSGPSGYAIKPGAWRGERSECPAGAMTARGAHPLDAMIALAGAVTTVYAHSDRRIIAADVDDVTAGLLRFAGGATGTIASHHATAEIWRLQVYGSDGTLEMRDDTGLQYTSREGEKAAIPLSPLDKERAELEAFANAASGGPAFPVTPEQAINTVAVIEAMAASAADGRPHRIV